MKKKDPKKTEQPPKKLPHPPKDFVPLNMLSKLKPQSQIILPQEKIPSNFEYKYSIQPNLIMPEWTYQSTDEVNKDICNDIENLTNNLSPFEDPDHDELEDSLPLYFLRVFDKDLTWDRPETFVPNYYIDREIKRLYPKKHFASMREDIRKNFYKKMRTVENKDNNNSHEENEDEDIDNYLKNDEEIMKQTIYKDFYKILEKDYKYEIVNYDIRVETDEEYIKRKEIEEKEKQILKKGTKKLASKVIKNTPIKIDESEKKIFRIIKPNVINISDFINNIQIQNSFYSWLASIYQMIIDLDICDVSTNKSILYNIYPQKEGAPIYNPNGKYIIKLYHMGKERKVVIDDRIPMNKDHELIIPHCTQIEELWPMLLTKAILKLTMYKTRHPLYYRKEEFMDTSIIYALTGMQTICLDLNSEIISLFKNSFIISSEEEDNEQDKKEEGKNEQSENKNNTNNNNNNNTKMYYALYSQRQTGLMKIGEGTSYSSILNKIELSKPRNQNLHYLNEQKIIRLGKTRFTLNRSIFKTIEVDDQTADKIKELRQLLFQSSNASIASFNTPIFQGRSKKKFPTITHKKISTEYYRNKELLISNDNIIGNFLYSVNDFFDNLDFNMKRLRFIDFSDLLRELTDKKVQFKQLPVSEKKKYLIERRELKKQKIEEKNNRLNELKEKGKQYNLVKILNRAVDLPKLDFFNEYTEHEINWAKKCILNKWKFPPISSFEADFKKKEEQQKKNEELLKQEKGDKINEIDTLIMPIENKDKEGNKKKKYGAFEWTKEQYIEFIGDSISYSKPLKPKISNLIGTWMTFEEIINSFNKILIIQNQSKIYHDKIIVDNSWHYYKTDAFEQLEEYNTFVFTPIEPKQSEDKDTKDNNSILVIFEPFTQRIFNNALFKNVIYPYISFDIINMTTREVVESNIILNQFYSIFSYSSFIKDNEYILQIKSGSFPVGYILQVMSEKHTITNISNNNYLKQYENFIPFNLSIEYPPIEKDRTFILTRIIMQIKEENEIEKEKIKIKISIKAKAHFLKNYIRIYMVQEGSFDKKQIEVNEIITMEKDDVIKNTYYFIISIKSQITLQENSLDIEILCNEKSIKFDQIESIEPYEIQDKPKPNRKGIIFSYYLYPSDKVICSLDIRLYHKVKEIKLEGNGKKGKSQSNSEQSNSYIESTPLTSKNHINLELYHLTKEPSLEFTRGSLRFSYSNQGTLISKWDFFNEITIAHLNLNGDLISPSEPKKKSKKDLDKVPIVSTDPIYPYLLLCFLDLTEPNIECIENQKNDIGYTITVFSSDNIAFITDTSKEDHEREMKENWESNDVGRALRAEKSRKKFLIYEKFNKQQPLNTEEKNELNEERERRVFGNKNPNQHEEDKENAKDIKRGIIKRKSSELITILKKPQHKGKGQEKEEGNEKGQLFDFMWKEKSFSMKNIFQSHIPKLNNSKSEYIKNYINYSNKERTVYNLPRFNQNFKLVDDVYREEMKKIILCHFEESEKKFKSYKDMNESNRGKFFETLRVMGKGLSACRVNIRGRSKDLLVRRNNIKEEIFKKIVMERKMNEIMQEYSYSNNNIDFAQMASVYTEAIGILGKNNRYVNIFFAFCSKKREEAINLDLKKLTHKDKNNIVKIIEEVKYNKWAISEETMSILKSLLK